LAGVQAGYIDDATTLNSSMVAAAVDAGDDEGVAEGVGAGVAVLVVAAVGFAGDSHPTSSVAAIIRALQANRCGNLTQTSCSGCVSDRIALQVAAP
jgi:hypothetical protein